MSVNIVGKLAGLWVAIVVASFTSCTAPQRKTSKATEQTKPLTFVAADGHTFEGRIDFPPADQRNGWGVLMIGGGFGNDLDWTVPGSMQIDGKDVQFTTSGQTHADAPLISRALVDRGFAVMRWSTIRIDDPLRDRWPIEATPYPLATMWTTRARRSEPSVLKSSVIRIASFCWATAWAQRGRAPLPGMTRRSTG